MMQSPYKVAYKSLSEADCSDCGRAIDFNKLKLQRHDSEEIRDDYDCGCGATFQIRIEIQAEQVRVKFVEDGQRVSDMVVPRATIRQRSHSVDTHVGEAHKLGILQKMLTHNIERVLYREDELYEWYKSILDQPGAEGLAEPVMVKVPFSQRFSPVHLDIHNYLSTVYTCDQYLSTLDTDEIEWPDEVQQEFEQYSKDVRAIKGLRHYVQHEDLLPFCVNQAPDREKAYLYVDLSDVQVMESEISQESPDGYSRGAEHHYGHIDASRINISHQVREHYFDCSELMKTIINTAVEIRGEEIGEYESIELPTLDDIDHPSSPSD